VTHTQRFVCTGECKLRQLASEPRVQTGNRRISLQLISPRCMRDVERLVLNYSLRARLHRRFSHFKRASAVGAANEYAAAAQNCLSYIPKPHTSHSGSEIYASTRACERHECGVELAFGQKVRFNRFFNGCLITNFFAVEIFHSSELRANFYLCV
jgi:hypothetical protein